MGPKGGGGAGGESTRYFFLNFIPYYGVHFRQCFSFNCGKQSIRNTEFLVEVMVKTLCFFLQVRTEASLSPSASHPFVFTATSTSDVSTPVHRKRSILRSLIGSRPLHRFHGCK